MSTREKAVRVAYRVRSLLGLGKIASRQRAFKSFDISRPWLDGFLDRAEVDPCGIIRLVGWRNGSFDTPKVPSIYLDGQLVPFLHHFRFTRNDIVASPGALFSQTGWALDYLVPESSIGRAGTLSINLGGAERIEFKADFSFVNPHYRNLLSAQDAQHRDDIYGSGPPNASVHPEVLELAKQLKGPVLDYGCGRGALVASLQRLGIKACGLELDTELIRQSIPKETAEAITLYDGSFPSPFKDGQFRSVMCSEVLEHISGMNRRFGTSRGLQPKRSSSQFQTRARSQ